MSKEGKFLQETMVLRRWENTTGQFSVINRAGYRKEL